MNKFNFKKDPNVAVKKKKDSLYFLRLSIRDQILFVKRLGVLIKAGVPILEALNMLSRQARTSSTSHIMKSLVKDVEQGEFLSKGLGRFKNIFGDFAVNIVEVGEASGTLPENLEYLAEELGKKQALRKKVVGAMIYPVFIVIATLGIVGLLTIYLFPKILPIFKSFSFDLPFTTKALIFFSDFVLNHKAGIAISILGIIVLFQILMRVTAVRYWIDYVMIRIPIFGSITQGYYIANICRTLGLLLRGDVRVIQAATITANTTTNLVYKQELEKIATHVTAGEKISAHMAKRPKLFPPIVFEMIAIGENTGTLSDSLTFISDLYENEVTELTKNLSSLIEPVLMITMGVIVGFVAVSIITPIYELTQHIHP